MLFGAAVRWLPPGDTLPETCAHLRHESGPAILDGLSYLFVPLSYPSDGVSHFRGLLDNFLISRMHATLFFGMLLRLPLLIARHWRAR